MEIHSELQPVIAKMLYLVNSAFRKDGHNMWQTRFSWFTPPPLNLLQTLMFTISHVWLLLRITRYHNYDRRKGRWMVLSVNASNALGTVKNALRVFKESRHAWPPWQLKDWSLYNKSRRRYMTYTADTSSSIQFWFGNHCYNIPLAYKAMAVTSLSLLLPLLYR